MAEGLQHHRPSSSLFESEEPDHVEAIEQLHLDAGPGAAGPREQFETTMAIDGTTTAVRRKRSLSAPGRGPRPRTTRWRRSRRGLPLDESCFMMLTGSHSLTHGDTA